MIIIILLVITFLLSIYYYTLHYGRKGRLLNLIPGPSALPIFGNVHLLTISPRHFLQEICKLQDQYYPIIRLWICHKSLIGICHPDDMKTILSNIKHIEKNFLYKVTQSALGDGLFNSGGSKWHTRRKILTPAFHYTLLEQFVDTFNEESNRMVMTLKNAKGPVVKSLVPFISVHALNIICETTMGVIQRNSTVTQNFHDYIQQMTEIVTYKFFKIWLHNEWITTLLPIGKKQKKLLSSFYSVIKEIIAERKQYHERTNGRYLNIKNDTFAQVDDTKNSENKTRRLALLDLLIALSQKNKLTDSDIMDEVNTFIVAGYDTSAMTICFALILLAKHKNIQDRVRSEVNSIYKQNGEKFTMSSLQQLLYLERCLKETMRLYPAGPFIARLTAEDVKLQSYTVPAETNVFLNIYALHRDPKFWSNPELFDPDRFLPERSKHRHPYSYLPFSAGPRNCIGQRFASLEIKAIIANLIQNFYIEPVDHFEDIEVMMKVMLCPTREIYVRFVPIDVTILTNS